MEQSMSADGLSLFSSPAAGLPLVVHDLGKRFGQRIVLDSINLHIPAGQSVAIVGRSGCGKSTLLRILAGLDVQTNGTLQAQSGSLNDMRHNIRLMFQDARLLPWKRVIDNVGIGLRGNWHEQAQATLKAVGLDDHSDDWPSSLSGGQRQRVALARVLIHQPQLLLLDEPLGALDALTRIEMQQLITRLWQEKEFTLLLVTHDVSEAVMMAQRVIMIDQGRVGLDMGIDLPYPRVHGDARLAALEGEILDRLLHRAGQQAATLS
jgi:sulfonate transport system ATP-binding protein